MITTFELKKGKLVFEEEKIVIADHEKIRWRLFLFFTASVVIGVLTLVVAYFTTGEQYQTWSGFFVGTAFVLAFVVSPFRSVQNVIDLKEVKSMKLTSGLMGEYLEIRLTNYKVRRVYAVVDKVGLKEYIDKDYQSKPLFEDNKFELRNGNLLFEKDGIVISDNAKSQRKLRLFSSAMWMIFGAMSVLRYLKTGDQFLLWTGLLIGIGHLVIFILNLFKSVQSEIALNEVKSMKIKKRAANVFLDIKLNNHRTRRVTEIFNPDRLGDYIEKFSLPN